MKEVHSRHSDAWLAAILLFAFSLRVACALLFRNVNHSDEIFQYVEPAHRAVFGYGLQTWEFRLGGRSWLIPGLVAGIMWVIRSANPPIYLAAIAIVMSVLSLSTVAVAFSWGKRYGTTSAVVTGVLAASWPELVYFGPKTLSDPLAADALVVALFLIYPDVERRSRRAFFLAGLFLGLAFALRFQLSPLFAITALYTCRLSVKERWLPLVLGAAFPVVAAGVLDAVTYSYPFQSILLPLQLETEGRAYSAENIEPWYYYVGVLTLNWSGAVVPLAVFAWIGARRLPLLAILISFTLIFYSLIGLKAYRYIYPALPLLIILVGVGTGDVVRNLAGLFPRQRKVFITVAVGGWIITSAALAVTDHFRTYLTKDGAIVDAFDQIGKRADLCGLGVAALEGWRTAGYTHLHRDVPMYLLPQNEIAQRAPSFNYMIAPAGTDAAPFAAEGCAPNSGFNAASRKDICVYHRPGPCIPSSERTMQSQM